MDYSRVAHMYEDGDDLRYCEYGYMDMKGWFPARLMNMMVGALYIEQMKKLVVDARNH